MMKFRVCLMMVFLALLACVDWRSAASAETMESSLVQAQAGTGAVKWDELVREGLLHSGDSIYQFLTT